MQIASIAAERFNATLQNAAAKPSTSADQPAFQDILSTVAQDDGAKVKKAAQQFEGLILGQMLKSIQESSGDSALGSGDDAAGSTALELAFENIAQTIAANGGLGLAKFAEKGLAQKAQKL